MARPGITYTEVAKAAAALQREGETPTVDKVRAALGDTGSKSTIAPYLKQWKSKQPGLLEAQDAGVPPELLLMVKNLHEEMQNKAKAHIETLKFQNQAELEVKNQEIGEAQKRIAELYSSLKERDNTIESLEKANESLQLDLRHTQQTHVETQSQRDALSQRLEDRIQEIARLNTMLEQIQQNHVHYRDSVQTQREQERSDYERQVGNAERAYHATEHENKRLQDALKQSDTTLTHLETERDQLNDQVKALTNRTQQDQMRLETLNLQYITVDREKQDAGIELARLKEKAMLLDTQAAFDRQQMRKLESANSTSLSRQVDLMEKHKALIEEKALIEGQLKQLQSLFDTKFKE